MTENKNQVFYRFSKEDSNVCIFTRDLTILISRAMATVGDDVVISYIIVTVAIFCIFTFIYSQVEKLKLGNKP